jgi:multicomponent Na+:H+ antiporter subunit B
MSLKTRTRLFLAGGVGFLALFICGLRGLRPVGQSISPYAEKLNVLAVSERHITDAVSAVNFDFRAFDTMGEEYILFTSVLGILLLLRKQQDEAPQAPQKQAPGREVPPSSDAVRVCALGLMAPSLLFGIYTVTHGQVTPGGGFQGGIILATALLFIFLAGDYEVFNKVNAHRVVELAEAAGAAGFILIGLAAAILGEPYLNNFLPLGKAGTVFAGGTVPLINLSVGIEVAAGILLLATAFLEETLVLQTKKGK